MSDKKKYKIISLVGATAVGKTEISIKLAKKFNCEIVSIDSVQVYKKFNIGSAKIREDEMGGIKHHLIDILEPTAKFSVYDFQVLARKTIEDIISRGKTPLLIGGTGYYMNAVIYDYNFGNYDNKEENYNINEMLNYIKKEDEETYKKIDVNNERRIINAFNYIINEKKSFSENMSGNNIYYKYNPYIIILNRERENIYSRINSRVNNMISDGLIDEVKNIVNNYGTNLQAISSIGYKEVLSYLKEEISMENMIESIKQNSRRYAKRQLTWFRNKIFNGHWYNIDKNEHLKIEIDIEKFLANN